MENKETIINGNMGNKETTMSDLRSAIRRVRKINCARKVSLRKIL